MSAARNQKPCHLTGFFPKLSGLGVPLPETCGALPRYDQRNLK
jgi:hypothetical protein